MLLEMNDRAAEVFAADGGRQLIGRNILDCHPEPARTKTQDLLKSGDTVQVQVEPYILQLGRVADALPAGEVDDGI